jgi:hypothetical protein
MSDPKIKLKRSSVEGKIPTPDQVPLGELALNTYDGQLYASKNVGVGTTVIAINPFKVGTGTDSYDAYFTQGNVGIGTEVPDGPAHSSNSSVLNVGVVTANYLYGDGSNISNISGTVVSGVVTNIQAGNGITILESPSGNFIITSTAVGSSATRTVTSQTATAGQTTFSVSYTVNNIDVYLNGAKLESSEFTATNGTSVVLATGATANDVLEFVVYKFVGIAVTATGSNGQLQYYDNGSFSSAEVYYTNGNLGIGTATPLNPVSVGNTAILNVGVVTANYLYGDGSNLTGLQAGYFEKTSAGINTLSNIGIGTTNPTSALTVSGDANVTGVVTATSFVGDGSNLTGLATALSEFTNDVGFVTNVVSGVLTATSFVGDGSNLTGLQAGYFEKTDVGINTLSNIGIGTTNPTSALTVSGDANVTGVVSTTELHVGIDTGFFTEDLVVNGNARVTGILSIGTATITIDPTTNSITADTFVGGVTGDATGLTGSPSITVTDITASGNVSIAGTLTYEDVTNVDSVGLITARSGIIATGVVTATSFVGDGSNLTGLATALSEFTNDVGFVTFTNNNQLTNGAGYITNVVSGVLTATSFVGDGSNLTGLATALSEFTNDVGFVTFTNVSQLTNDTGFITNVVSGVLTATSFSGDGSNLTGLATALSEFTNDVGFVTFTNNNQLTNGAGYITNVVSGVLTATSFSGDGSNLTGLATALSEFTNDVGFVTFTNVSQLNNDSGYITTSFTSTSQLTNDAGFITNVVSGVLTATSFSGDGSNLTGIQAGYWEKTDVGINTSTNIGIGTTNPTSALTVSGDANITGVVTASSFVGSAANLTSLTGASSGTYGTVGAVPVITVDANGRITGITTTVSTNTSTVTTRSTTTTTATAGQTTFSVTYSVGYVDVYLNGVRLASSDFTATNGTSVVLGTAASLDDVLEFVSYSQVGLSTVSPDIVGDTTPQLGGNLDLNSNDITGTGNVNITGVVTATSFSGDGSNLTGLQAGYFEKTDVGINTLSNIGIGTTNPTSALTVSGDANVTGVITATSFVGDVTGDATGLSGSPSITVTDITASGNVSIAGTLTYEDVTNVDSVGLITARSGIDVTGHTETDTLNVSGIATAAFFYGDGSNLTGLQAGYFEKTDVGINTLSNIGIGTTNPTSALTVSGDVNVTGVITATSFVGSAANLTSLTGASSGTYGDSGSTPVITIDSNGRITGISTTSTGTVTTRSTTTTTATSGQTTFSVTYSVGYVDVFQNGVKLDSTEFTATNGTSVVLTTGAVVDDILEFVAYSQVGLSTVVPDIIGDTTPQLGGNLDLNGNDVTGTGDFNVTGVITATSFVGNITGSVTGDATGLSGSPSITVTDITASGNVSIAGTITYEDVTNVDSVGLITARSGIHVTGGSVGIGTDNPGTKLDVRGGDWANGDIVVGEKDNAGRIKFARGADGSDSGSIGFAAADSNSVLSMNVASGDGTLTFQTNSTERVRITSGGLVGIGTNNPGERLDVDGSIRLRASNYTTYATRLGARLDSTHVTTLESYLNSGTPFELIGSYADGGGANPRVVLAAGGQKVGIGTDNPARKLHIHENSSNGCFLSITNDTTGSGAGDGALIGLQSDESLLISQKESNSIFFHTSNTDCAYFSSGGTFALVGGGSVASPAVSLNGSAPSNSMVLNTLGNLGLGTNNPDSKLEVLGDVNFAGGLLKEGANITAGKLSDNTNINLSGGMVHLFTTTETTTSTPNLRYDASTSLDSKMSVGESITVVLIVTAAAAGYSAQLTIDGSAVTESWLGGSAPSAGSSSGYDVYTYNIIKTGSSTFVILANLTNFA